MQTKTNCPCVLPGATEEEVVTLAGEKPGTALRLRVEASAGGYVRLEQLAYSHDLGWYTQKSFCVPGETLAALLPHLRRASCLIPRRPAEPLPRTKAADTGLPLRFPGIPGTQEALVVAGVSGASGPSGVSGGVVPSGRPLSPMATPPSDAQPQRREA